jgi:hypothetical protein
MYGRRIKAYPNDKNDCLTIDDKNTANIVNIWKER